VFSFLFRIFAVVVRQSTKKQSTSSIMAQHNETGKWGEQVAVEHLQRKGYTIRNRNWRVGHREIDIVALTADMRTLVFVEVKTREKHPLVSGDTAIDVQKIRNIGYAANAYLQHYGLNNNIRFDIVCVSASSDGSAPVVEHWEDAFNPMLAY
jgi:putative endonuclease